MVCGCFFILRADIVCNYRHFGKCVTILHPPEHNKTYFLGFFVELLDGSTTVIDNNDTYIYLSGLFKNRARGVNSPNAEPTYKMQTAIRDLAHLDNLRTSYLQLIPPNYESLQWWKRILLHICRLSRVKNATYELMSNYYEEHIISILYNRPECKINENKELQQRLEQMHYRNKALGQVIDYQKLNCEILQKENKLLHEKEVKQHEEKQKNVQLISDTIITVRKLMLVEANISHIKNILLQYVHEPLELNSSLRLYKEMHAYYN